MGKNDAVWGIDIGQCALKALRCRVGDEPGEIIAEAFDYVEYPQILSQPEADPAELVREALQTFLSRNNVRGDGVAISVPGQSGLSRFIKLPPVEASKIPDIVKYEARQQIPFALEDVVWDYQQLSGGVEEGYALETEVGLFAMKREQVFRALQPFEDANIEVDFVQLAPLALYNYALFDQIAALHPGKEIQPNSGEWIVVMSLGTDTTDLVLTDGFRVWQRNIPLGGNHFTRALTKSMKLTFAKAEHLKRNATKSDDPKAVYQTMRSVCNDLVTELHRSLSYFGSLEKDAKIVRVLAMGNTMKLHGLPQFLAKHLEMTVTAADSFRTLTGAGVVGSPAFKDNVLSYPVCYGLAIQALDQARLKTNLLPREILKDRLVREKKPWAVAAVAAVLLAFVISFFGHWQAWSSANVNHEDFDKALKEAQAEEKEANDLETKYNDLKKQYDEIDQVGKNLVANVDGRVSWLELLKAVNDSLPEPDDTLKDKPVWKRPELHIEKLDCERYDKLEEWFSDVKEEYQKGKISAPVASGGTPANGTPPAAGTPAAATAPPAASAPAEGATAESGPTGPGWVIEIKGYHLFNEKREGPQFVRDTLLKNLTDEHAKYPGVVCGLTDDGKVKLPVRDKDGKWRTETVTMKELGISYPVMLHSGVIDDMDLDVGEDEAESGGSNGHVKVGRFEFIIQFSWQESPPDKRHEKEEQQKSTGQTHVADAATQTQRGGE